MLLLSYFIPLCHLFYPDSCFTHYATCSFFLLCMFEYKKKMFQIEKKNKCFVFYDVLVHVFFILCSYDHDDGGEQLQTMGLADCSENIVLPSVESAEFVSSCRKYTSVKHVKKMQSWTLNKSAKVKWTRVETHAGEKLPLWSSDGDRIIKSPKSVGEHKRNTHKPQKYQQTWNKSNIKQVWSVYSAVHLRMHADTKDDCL